MKKITPETITNIVIPECFCRESSDFTEPNVTGSSTKTFGDDNILLRAKVSIKIFLLTIVISACSTRTSDFTEIKPDGLSESVIYIYRPHSMSNIMDSPEFYVNRENKYTVLNNRYSYLNMVPGQYYIKLDLAERYTGKQELTLDLSPGEIVYLRITTTLKFEKNKPYTRTFDIEAVSKEIAHREMKRIKLMDVDKKIDEKSKMIENDNQDNDKTQFSISKTRNPFAK